MLLSIWAFTCIVMWKGQWKDYIQEQFGVVNVPILFLHLKEKNSVNYIKKGEIISTLSWTKGKRKVNSVYGTMVNLRNKYLYVLSVEQW